MKTKKRSLQLKCCQSGLFRIHKVPDAFVCGRYFSFAPVAVKLVQGAERFFLVGWMTFPAWLESQDETSYNNIS